VPDRGYEVIEHTADVGLRVWAPTLEEVFAQAAVGLIEIMGTADGDPVTERVQLESTDVDGLFVDWLSEVLFLFEAREIVPLGARVAIDRDHWSLDATIEGTRIMRFTQTGPGVKAVTFHGLEVSESEAVVYLDV
jgi:SHS2 domain-containing protein